MIHTTANGVDLQLPEGWHEITLDQASALRTVEPIEDTFKQIEQVKQAIAYITNVQTVVQDRISPIVLVHIYTKYIAPYHNDLHKSAPETYTPKLIKQFKHKGTTYLMPEHLIIDEETIVLQHGQRVKNFIEASNLLKRFAEMKTEGFKVLSLFIAAIVKEDKDELFDEKRISERAKLFNDLPMDIVWEVFFCTSEHTLRYMSDTLQSMTTSRREKPTLLSRQVMKLGRLQLRKAALLEELKQLTR